MSSKFSGLSKTQKPPAVCKKPPPPPPLIVPSFLDTIFQGYAYWYDPQGTDKIALTGYFLMVPYPPGPDWRGFTHQKPYALHLNMQYDQVDHLFSYWITLTLNAGPVGAYQILRKEARTINPFDSGLLNFDTNPTPTTVQARIFT